MRPVGLRAQDHDGPGGVRAAIGLKVAVTDMHLRAAEKQHVQQPPDGGGIAVVAGDEPRPGRTLGDSPDDSA